MSVRALRLRLAALTVIVGGLGILFWMSREMPMSGSTSKLESEPEPTSVARWQTREPGVAVIARPAATSDARHAWRRHITAVTPVEAPAELILLKGARMSLPLPDGRVLGGEVRLVREHPGGGEVAGGRLDDGGTFTLAHRAGQWTGVVLPKDGATVYRVFQADDGGTALASVPRESVLCASLPRGPKPAGRDAKSRGTARFAAAEMTGEVPLLDSRADAAAVIFLDFDGATVEEPFWNGGEVIVAEGSGLSSEAIFKIWRRVAEDYAPFNINVTTDPARYDAARPMQRMRCIITTSNEWYGDDIGGVAAIYSWPHAGIPMEYYPGQIPYAADIPCWAFSDVNFFQPDHIALAVSHEVGHTFGLFHDGAVDATGEYAAEYYEGHGEGATSWGPIMGAPYGRALIQWNNGDYAGQMMGVNAVGDMLVGDGFANNQVDDDVAVIGGIVNHAGFAPERRGTSLADAGRLNVASDGATVDHLGMIEVGGAESWLLVAVGEGAVELALVAPDAADEEATNVDAALTLTDLAGNVIATAEDVAGRFPALSTTVPAAGVYVLRVVSTGQGDPADGGYSAYGSAGRFRVQGVVVAASGVGPAIGGGARVEGREGETMSYAIEAAGVALSYSATGLPPGLTVGTDGVVSGVPTQAGIFSAEVRATNAWGSVTREVTFAVATESLSEALDAPWLVFTTGGDRPWRSVAESDAPTGGSAARSGEVLDGFQLSWIETELRGPGRLRWRWKVSSETDFDFYRVWVNNALFAEISGDTEWAEEELELPTGAHTVRWSYEKDPFFSDFQDSAWLDDVRWNRGFEFWADAAELVGADAAHDADADGDGVANLLEYAFGLSPLIADGLGGVVSVEPSEDEDAAGALEIAFDRPAGRVDLRYVVEVSGDLLTWERGHAYGEGADNAGEQPTVEVSRAPLGGGAERIHVRDKVAAGMETGTNRRFIRVRIERT